MSNIYIYIFKEDAIKTADCTKQKSHIFIKQARQKWKQKQNNKKNMRQTRRRAWNISRPPTSRSEMFRKTTQWQAVTMNENAYSTYWLKLMILYNKRKQEKKTYYLRVVNRKKKKHSEEEKLLLYYYWLRTSRKKVTQRKSEWNIETTKKKNIWKVYKAKHTLVFISVLILEPVSFELSLYSLVCLGLSALFLLCWRNSSRFYA